MNNTKETEGSKYIVAFAAGDGTFMNVVKEIKSYGLIFWVLRFGTAWDLSRTLGWGPRPSLKMRNNLEVLWQELWNATVVDFDIWEISVITDDLKGNKNINFNFKVKTIFIIIYADIGNIQMADGKQLKSYGESTMTKLMAHSFSLGVDARIGINFERRRTRSRFCNQFMYGWEGLKRLFCWCKKFRTLKVTEIWSALSITKPTHK